MRLHHGLTLFTVACLFSSTAAAQERLELLVPSGFPQQAMLELDVSAGGFGALRHVTPLPRAGELVYTVPVAFGGDRYLVWLEGGRSGSDPRHLRVFDRRTRTVTSSSGPWATTMLPDPLRSRIFSDVALVGPSQPGQLFVLDIPSGRTRALQLSSGGATAPTVQGFTYAAEADRLIVKRSRFTNPGFQNDIAVVDVATGVTLRSFDLPVSPATQLLADPGARLVYLSTIGQFGPAPIIAFDLATGVEVARSAVFQGPQVRLDDSGTRLLVAASNPPALHVLDAMTLVELHTRPATAPATSLIALPGHEATGAYLVQGAGSAGACWYGVERLDTTWVTRASLGVNLGADLQAVCSAAVTLVQPPAAPTPLTAHVAGTNVALAWRNPGNATAFELEVGLAPGTTALRIPGFASTSTALANAPPGTYYVRVVALNEQGRGVASNEVRVEVP